MDKHIVTIQKQKRTVTKLMQENESAKHRHQVSFMLFYFYFLIAYGIIQILAFRTKG